MGKKVLLIGGNSLVGKSIASGLDDDYQIISTAGHHAPENGYQLMAEEPDKLEEILAHENPEIVISSIRGSYQSQMSFHKTLADWLAGEKKRLLYISTANVFDGNLSRPWTEHDLPMPESDYGSFKWDCETMLGKMLEDKLIIFRLAAVWSADCPRVQQLKLHSRNKEPYRTYPNYRINITHAKQIGNYAKYVLDNNLHGIFHVGTTDTVNYFSFEKMVCEALKIDLPQFVAQTEGREVSFAILSARKDIPDDLQMTVSDVLAYMRTEDCFKHGRAFKTV